MLYVQCNHFQNKHPECDNHIRVEPLENNNQPRGIHCHKCGADIWIRNSELRVG